MKSVEKEILADQIQIDTKRWKFEREEIYERWNFCGYECVYICLFQNRTGKEGDSIRNSQKSKYNNQYAGNKWIYMIMLNCECLMPNE